MQHNRTTDEEIELSGVLLSFRLDVGVKNVVSGAALRPLARHHAPHSKLLLFCMRLVLSAAAAGPCCPSTCCTCQLICRQLDHGLRAPDHCHGGGRRAVPSECHVMAWLGGRPVSPAAVLWHQPVVQPDADECVQSQRQAAPHLQRCSAGSAGQPQQQGAGCGATRDAVARSHRIPDRCS